MRFSRVWGRTGSPGVSAASTRLTRRLEPVCSLGTEAMKARATLLVSRLAVPGSASSTLRSISSVSVTGSAWTFACSWLGVSGRGSRRSAASAVARDSRIWANDSMSCWESMRSLEGGGDAAGRVGLGDDQQLGGALVRRGGADRGDDRAGGAQQGGRHDQDHVLAQDSEVVAQVHGGVQTPERRRTAGMVRRRTNRSMDSDQFST